MSPGKSTVVTALTSREGQALLWLARQTIAQRLGLVQAPAPERQIAEALASPRLQEQCGVFVTLKCGGSLRGCIGCLSAAETVIDGVRDNALKAAFSDPRFPPLTAAELPGLQIELSVLTPLEPLVYDDAAELLSRLHPGRDGVLIEQGGRSATFLPQVWEQLPEPQIFLEHLCRKAGLPGSAWREGNLRVKTYQVQSFVEP